MISRLKTRSDDPTSRARIVTRTSTSRPCAHTSKTSTLANLKSPYVFNDEEELPFKPQNLILTDAKEWFTNAYAPNSKTTRVPVSLVWEPPNFGYFKLNVDGSRKPATGAIGAGDVIRNSDGEWIAGFTVNLGKAQILDAEIWGLAFGLKLAVDRGIPNFIVEMDSTTTVHLIQSPDIINFHSLAGVICSCKEYMEKINNCVADCLANSSYNSDLGELDAFTSHFDRQINRVGR